MRSPTVAFWVTGVVLLAGAFRGWASSGSSAGPVDFDRDIGPLLAERCGSCHGSKRSESGLSLDSLAAALRGGDHGPALVPGKAGESLLMEVVTGRHAELARMPKKGEALTTVEVERIRAWIDAGATWPVSGKESGIEQAAAKHWAFQAPVRPPVPELGDGWIRNPIDAFVLERLRKEGMEPSPEADPITLLRRVSLDLTGLPPTLAEVGSGEGYSAAVERLLKSPHHGERWGRHWLDAARYADSDGFEKDKARFVWFYRDWVVDAINRDLPYDRFVMEQMAGDLMPDATQDMRVATGFLRNSMINEEGGVDPEQFRMEAMFDRMDAVGKGVLGLTIQCAQCHTHKFDPLTHEEYYRMFAFLNNDHEGTRVVYRPDQLQRIEGLRREMRTLEEELRHRTPDWEERMARWEESVKDPPVSWQVVEARNAGDNSARYEYLADGSILAGGYAPTQWTSEFRTTNTLPRIGGFRLEQLPHADLPSGGPGRSIRGMAALSEFKVEVQSVVQPTNKFVVKFVRAEADFSNAEKPLEAEFDNRSGKKRTYGPVMHAIDGSWDTAWGIDAGPGRRNVAREAVFIPEKPVEAEGGVVLTFHLVQSHGGWNSDDNQNHNLGRFRLSVTDRTNAVVDPVPARVRPILSIPREARSMAQKEALFSVFRMTVPEWAEVNGRIEELWGAWPEGDTTLTLMPRDEPRETRVLKRGDWLKPGGDVGPGVPGFLHGLPEGADGTRLTFARWLVDRRSPTTARVWVNRVWQQYFGVGLVETPEDFGLQAPAPTHPELLDWLACEFMDSGWSMKALHRLIVTSATYRQSSRVKPEMLERDPNNRWLSRMPRLRVEGEIVRDIALSVSGLLNPKLGGPGIFTPAPDFLFKPPASYGPFEWVEETGPDRYRRALYTFRRRSTPYPALQNFDVPNADFSCVRRPRSNTPLQALTTLNETLFVESARALARRILEEGGRTDEQRLGYAFRRVLSRTPSSVELAELTGLLERQRVRIADGWVSAHELSTGRSAVPDQLPEGVTPTQLAAYTAISRVLLNLDETITRE